MSVSVKRKPVFCGACSMDISNTVRIRCAQLGPPPAAVASTSSSVLDGPSASTSSSVIAAQATGSSSSANGVTKKHESVDSLPVGPRNDGLVPTCDEFDICGSCFCEGKEIGRHKRWHDYRVVTQHAYPIFTDDWGADEELLLISACQAFGLGNWADIAEHIGSYRTKEDVEEHYLATYIRSPNYPLPVEDVKLVDQDTFQARKKQRLEDAQNCPVPIPVPKPLASAPTCHEISGFMPGRLEFETEWENDAEALIKDMEFGLVSRYGGDEQPTREEALGTSGEPDPLAKDSRQPQAAAPSNRGLGASTSTEGTESEQSKPKPEKSASSSSANQQQQNGDVATANQTGEKGKDGDENVTDQSVVAIWQEGDDDLELKLTMHEIYNSRIERRLDAKALIFDRGLLDYKKIIAVDKKRPKEERELLNRVKVFSRLQTAADHEEFSNGLLYEQMLRKQIADLQEYRQSGLTSFTEVDKYEKDKANRIAARGANNYRDVVMLSRSMQGRTGVTAASSREGTPRPPGTISSLPRRLPQPQLNLANSSSLQLLTPEETRLCSELRILPKPFLFIKQTLLREFARCGGKLERERALELLPKIEPSTVIRIWEEIFGVIQKLVDELMDEDDEDEDGSDPDGDEAETGDVTGNAEETSSSEDEGDLMGELQALQDQEQQMSTTETDGDTEMSTKD